MFHVELRRFPHVARAFNLNEDELRARIVVPFVRGAAVEFDERRWTPDKTRLTIYEAPAVAAEDRGLGRGWSTVTRAGEDVTARMLATARRLVPQAAEVKSKLLATAPIPLDQALPLASEGGGRWRASERLAVAEQAVWELLHERRLVLVRAGAEVPPEEWELLLLRWETWTGGQDLQLVRP